MIQILGASFFAREIAGYIQHILHEECEMIDTTVVPVNPALPTVIGIGSPQIRRKVFEENMTLDYKILHFGRHFGQLLIQPGIIICPGVTLTTDIKLGAFVIININSTVGHDCEIGDFTTISPGANISGNVKIGANCYIGTGAMIREGITICDDVVLGAGMIVVKDITEPGTYVLDVKSRKL